MYSCTELKYIFPMVTLSYEDIGTRPESLRIQRNRIWCKINLLTLLLEE